MLMVVDFLSCRSQEGAEQLVVRKRRRRPKGGGFVAHAPHDPAKIKTYAALKAALLDNI